MNQYKFTLIVLLNNIILFPLKSIITALKILIFRENIDIIYKWIVMKSQKQVSYLMKK